MPEHAPGGLPPERPRVVPIRGAPPRPALAVDRPSVDAWGRSERVRDLVRRAYDPVYRHWFRVEWEGLEHVPRQGGALLVGNHGGAIPSDAPVVMHGIEQELRRPVYGLGDNIFRAVPVVPMAIVGNEEAMPILWRSTRLARLLGIPYFPVTANQFVFGPLLGLVVPFPAKFRIRVLEPVRFDVPPGQERYNRSTVIHHAERIRDSVQTALHDMLRARRSVWRG